MLGVVQLVAGVTENNQVGDELRAAALIGAVVHL